MVNKFSLLLVFNTTPFKIDLNQNQNGLIDLSPESGKRKKVNTRRVPPRFRSQQVFSSKIWGEIVYLNL